MEDIDEIIDSGTGIVKEETYRGHKITVKRLTAEDCQLVHGVSSFKYEFEAYVDGEPVTVAGEIETRGNSNAVQGSESADSPQAYDAPWIPALVQYTKAYLDGLHDGVERDNPYTEWKTDSFQG